MVTPASLPKSHYAHWHGVLVYDSSWASCSWRMMRNLHVPEFWKVASLEADQVIQGFPHRTCLSILLCLKLQDHLRILLCSLVPVSWQSQKQEEIAAAYLTTWGVLRVWLAFAWSFFYCLAFFCPFSS